MDNQIELAHQTSQMLSVLDSSGSSGLPQPYAQEILLAERVGIARLTRLRPAIQKAQQLSVGDALRLERDQANLRARWAIKVYSEDGVYLGLLAADYEEILAHLMDAGKHLIAKVAQVSGNWETTRVLMEVYLDD